MLYYTADENNYYNEFNIVPTTLMDKLRLGQVKIINWHMLAWDSQDKLNAKVEKGQLRSVDKRKPNAPYKGYTDFNPALFEYFLM